MKHASGVPPQERWPTINAEQKIRCVERLSRHLIELAALQFPASGSLYISESLASGKEAIDIGSSFCIAHHCGTDYWPSIPTEPRYYGRRGPNRGPWKGLREYSTGFWMPDIYVCLPVRRRMNLRVRSISIFDYSKSVKKFSAFFYNKRIFRRMQSPRFSTSISISAISTSLDEDPRVVTAIIDWQSASIEPTFFYTHETPDFVEALADFQEYLRQFLGPSSENVSDDPAREKAKQKLEKGD
ncbi:hypothetical protein MBM_01928 [Drepanopeziza brunnea f. sp. 'multigermtubi' MB_m1]|uniref:Uncharacterized protein n=1 Tax=Marssonina brunnea f. sp. multigermtubi (strain MB_m1) TaxID=1072389 RepID=K1X436_MARBU|nr:uncharacterized protein MBM_01928 [Drepanopeziza brunnea f. sp. 'multigermtubi' MB_m1]EKD19976.1 hypothetical protein MBM_01928 [Drepanopeziza brunnea f. sp. 'multigermtubi' MB_m1]